MFDDGFKCNGTKSIELDNLSHVYVRKYIKKVNDENITDKTNLEDFVDENCKYRNFLADLIVKLESIEQTSCEKIGEIIEMILGIKIQRQRVHNLLDKKINEYLSMSIHELQEKILEGKIEFSGFVHYDEEFL